MEFRLLGSVEVAESGQSLGPARRQERCVLAVLLAHANHVVSGDVVAEALWPERDQPANALRSVQTHVSRLRSTLGPAGERILTRSPGYMLRVDSDELDAERFESLFEQARHRAGNDPQAAVSLLDQALGLWRGSPYGEFRHADFAMGDAVRLEELRLVAIEERTDARLALDRHEEAVGELEALCAEHPLRERMRGQLMVALYRSGRQPEALRAFEAYRRLLAEELGLDPSPELRALETRILAHDPELTPRPRAPQARGDLATPVTSFVGREDEVDDVVRILSTTRLLTLTGPGGMGKTRLAQHVAAAAAEAFSDGVVVCELAGVAQPDAVAPAVATALGIQPRPDRSVEHSVADVLRTSRMLLVIDNCEHVVDAAASLVSLLVESCPHVTSLATSRERLAIDGEQVWPVNPLGHDAAVELFCDRALAVRPDVDCGDEARATIAEICSRLDGLPLAIELAAAQVAVMNPADIVSRLDDRLRLLDRASRSRPSRHRSLRAVVDWSYERLTEPQRRLFDRLSVFAGGFTIEAAEDVCGGEGVDPAEVPGLLADLVDLSLVELVSGGDLARYRLLETLRAYGRERLDREELIDRLRDRHLDFYVGLVHRARPGLHGADEGRWIRRLDAELANLRTAHRWAMAHGDAGRALGLAAPLDSYAYRAMRPEVFAWAEAAAGLPGAAGHPLLPQALGSAATGAWVRGDLEASQGLAEAAVGAAAGKPTAHLAYAAMAGACLFRGDLAEAREFSRRAAELAAANGDHYWSMIDRMVETLAIAYGGDADAAIGRAEKTLADLRVQDCPSTTAWGLYHLAETLLDQDPHRALALADEARALAAGVGHVFLTGIAGTSATALRARHGDPNEALDRFSDLIDLWYRAGNWTQQWTLLRSLVGTLVRVGRDETAAILYGAMLSSPTAAPLYGADADRMDRAVRTMEDRSGRDQVADWIERGRRLRDDDVVDFARTAAQGS